MSDYERHINFRSKAARSGYFREPGTIHAHIDAGGQHLIRKVDQIVRELDARHLRSKSNTIVDSFKSSHGKHQDFAETYRNHSPGRRGEEFSVFSTTKFQNPKRIAEHVRYILSRLSRNPRVVVEVERVLSLSKNGEWKKPHDLIPSIDDADVGYEALYTQPLEIHLAFDLSKKRYSRKSKPLLSAREICRETDYRGLRVGEWFVFDKGTHWSYRSSQFLEIDGYEEIAKDYHMLLGECLKRIFRETILSWTLVEQILGLWKTHWSRPITYVSNKVNKRTRRFGPELTLPQLGKWEQSFSELKDFWGVVPNFLGDTNPDIRDAMHFNLRKRGTVYTYFLQSFADLQRLRAFTEDLRDSLRRSDLSSQIKPVLLSLKPGERLKDEYFIANPTSDKREGYRINRNKSGYVKDGSKLTRRECEEAVNALLPLLNRSIDGMCPPVIDAHEDALAIAFTDLENSTGRQHSSPPDTWEQVLIDYDRIIALETSKVSGEVIKALGDGYLLAFPNRKAAFDFAVGSQKAVDRHNAENRDRDRLVCIPNQRIALDFGDVKRVERSHGYDLKGDVLNRCSRIINLISGSHVIMTKAFEDPLEEAPIGFGRSGNTIKRLGYVKIRGFKNRVEVFELIWRDSEGIPIKPTRLKDLKGTASRK